MSIFDGFLTFSANKHSWICEKSSKVASKDLNKSRRELKNVIKPEIIKNGIEFKTWKKKWKLKTKYIETWKAKNQKDKNLVF